MSRHLHKPFVVNQSKLQTQTQTHVNTDTPKRGPWPSGRNLLNTKRSKVTFKGPIVLKANTLDWGSPKDTHFYLFKELFLHFYHLESHKVRRKKSGETKDYFSTHGSVTCEIYSTGIWTDRGPKGPLDQILHLRTQVGFRCLSTRDPLPGNLRDKKFFDMLNESTIRSNILKSVHQEFKMTHIHIIR